MKANRQLKTDNKAQMAMVGSAVGLFIMIIICLLVYWNIVGGTRNSMISLDQKKGGVYNSTQQKFTSGPHPADNATTQVNSQAATFFTIAPIIGVVIVAVVVISYIKQIG